MAIDKATRDKMEKSLKGADPERAQAILEILISRGDLTVKEIVDAKARIAELEDELEESKGTARPPKGSDDPKGKKKLESFGEFMETLGLED